MLFDIKGLRNRMLSCKPDSTVIITCWSDDEVLLTWVFFGGKYELSFKINQIRMDCRVFERAMHKAKRDMRKL